MDYYGSFGTVWFEGWAKYFLHPVFSCMIVSNLLSDQMAMDQSKKTLKRTAQSLIEPHEPQWLRSKSRLVIHPKWDQQLFGVNGQAWICMRSEGSTIFGNCFDCKVMSPPDSGPSPCPGPAIDGKSSTYACLAGFRISSVTPKSITIEYDQIREMATKAVFQAPRRVYEDVFKRGVIHVDVQSFGDFGAAVSAERVLKVFRMENEEVRHTVKDQGDLNVVKWIPGTSTFAYSAETSLIRLYSMDKNKQLRTLKGHGGLIQELVFADKGKHLFSASLDGKVLLWDVNRTEPLLTVTVHLGEVISCISLQTAHQSVSEAYSASEGSSDGRVLLYGTQDTPCLRITSVRANPTTQYLFEHYVEAPVTCCTFLDHPYFACGTDNGQLYYFDWRKPDRPVAHWREIRGGITTMTGWKGGVVCGTMDGSCFHRNPVPNGDNNTTIEYCGSDEPITRVCQFMDSLVTCGRDGKVRQYGLP